MISAAMSLYRLALSKRALSGGILFAMLLSLQGCVTTTDSPFERDASPVEAKKDYVQLAMGYIQQNNLERARKHADRALQIDPEYAPAKAAQGLIFQQEGEAKLAEQAFRQALNFDPSYTRGRVFYGAQLYSQGRFSEAVDQFSKASEDVDYPERGSVFYNLGRAQVSMGDYQAAVASFRRANELKRGDARTLLALSETLFLTGTFEGSSYYFTQLEDMIRRNASLAHSPASLLLGARLAAQLGDYDRESSYALMLRNTYPKSPEYKQYEAMK